MKWEGGGSGIMHGQEMGFPMDCREKRRAGGAKAGKSDEPSGEPII